VHLGLNYLLAGLLSVGGMALLGLLMERFLFRRLFGQFLASLVMSLGVLLAIEGLCWMFFGITGQAIPAIFPGVVRVLGATVSRQRLVVILGGLVLIGALFLFIRYTRTGRAIRAVEQNPDGAVLQGIDPRVTRRLRAELRPERPAAVSQRPSCRWTNMGHMPLLKGLVIIVLGGMGA
jgi:branched-chain amino acid transport system permease protein